MSTRAEQRGRAGSFRSLAVPVLVVSLGAALLTWASSRVPQSPPTGAASAVTALESVSLVCPAATAAGGSGSRTDLTVVSLPDATGQDRGRVTARTLPGGAPIDKLALRAPLRGVATAVPAADEAAVAVRGQGSLAPGLGAFAGTTAARDVGGGLTVAACPEADRSWRFVGAGATAEHASTVVLTNPDPTQAIVDINIVGPDGPLETVGTSGLVIPAGDTVAVDLTDVVAGRNDLAVDVEASQGRVVANVLDRWSDGQAPAGTEWLPAAVAPAREVTLLEAGSGTGERTLLVTNPGSRSVLVSATVTDADGTFVPQDVRPLELAPASVATVDLPRALGSGALTLRLSSPGPITATLRTTTTTTAAGPDRDVAYAAASLPLSGPAAAPLAGGATRLALTGLDLQANSAAVVETYGPGGKLLASDLVHVPAGTTRTVNPLVRRASGRALYVVVRPQQGAVYATAGYDRSSGTSLLALRTPAQTDLAPQVSARE